MRCAILGDIKDILTENDKKMVQDAMSRLIDQVNEKYRESIFIEFHVTETGEFRGILNRAGEIFYIIEYIIRKAHPLTLAFGVAIDDGQTEENSTYISTAYLLTLESRAERMLEYVRKRGRSKQSEKPEILFYSGQPGDDIINALLDLWCNIEKGWKKGQREIIYYSMEHRQNQSQIARHFGINQATVTRALKSSDFYKYVYALEMLQSYLEQTFDNE